MSEYGKLWQDLWLVRGKLFAMSSPREAPPRGDIFPETIEEARARVAEHKDRLDRLLAEWEYLERKMGH